MPYIAQQTIQQLLHDLPEAVYGLNRQLQITFTNPAALRQWQREEQDVLGHSVLELLSTQELEQFLPPLRAALETSRPTQVDLFSEVGQLWLRLSCYPDPQGLFVHLQRRSHPPQLTPGSWDPLTGAWLRSPFLEALAHLPRPAVLALLDLNHLKAINELHGHAGGDRHLRAFVRVLRPHLPAGSLLCRWGGDEFVVVAPGATLDHLTAQFLELKRHWSPVMLQTLNNSKLAAFEFGLALLETPQTLFEQAFAVADEHLHTAKHHQRNMALASPLDIAEFSRYLETLASPIDVVNGSLQRLRELLDFDLGFYTALEGGAVTDRILIVKPGLELGQLRSVAPFNGATPPGGLATAIQQQQQTVFATDYPALPNALPHLVEVGIKSVLLTPVWSQGQMVGILNLATLHRWRSITPQVRQLLELAALRLGHALELQRVTAELRATLEAGLLALGIALEARDFETQGHTQRVAEQAARVGQVVGLGEQDLHHLRQGVYLHDLGKLMIPDAILLKPGRLTPEERRVMEAHVVKGAQLAARLPGLPLAVLQIIESHHERWDGTGYPAGLAGEQIPFLARLFAVCDVFDALVSERPYKAAWSQEAALAEIRAQRGRQFCPQAVDSFLELME